MRDHQGYAPLDIVLDTRRAERRFGLVCTRVAAHWGTAVARHPSQRTGEIATVFLHGASGAWTGWTALLETARLEGVHIVEPVLIDLPGWGDGELTRPTVDIALSDIADLVREVLTRLGYTTWHLVGHSMGGLVALHLAATAAERVIAVGVVSTTSYSIIRSVEHPVREFRSVPAFTMLWRVMGILRALGGAGRVLVRAAATVGLMRIVFAPLFRFGLRMRATVVAATVDGIDPTAFLIAADVVRGYDADGLWSRIVCPVNAVAGDHDVFVGRDDLEQLQATISQAEITVIPDCGHFALVEWPSRTLRALGFQGDGS